MSRSLVVSRDALSLPPLQLWQPGAYVLPQEGFGPGTMSWRRQTVESEWVHGRFLITAARAQQTAQVVVHVQAGDGPTLAARIRDLLNAVSQFRYRLDFDYDGVAGAWECEPADYAVGPAGVFEEFELSFHEQPVMLQVPHYPVPLLGAI